MTTKTFSTHRPCPACAAGVARRHGEKNGFPLLICQTCGTLYTFCLPDPSGGQDYDAYYGPHNLATPDFVGRRLDEIVSTFAAHRQNNRLLDVGFGAGDLLRAAVRAGWDAEGIEVSQPAVESARTFGLKVFQGELAAAHYPDACFDVVTAVEVLEHVPDPQALVGEVARILRPGGLFWATTPHGRGLSARLLKTQWSVVSPPEHLQLLSPGGTKTLLKDAGFRSARVATQGVNPYEIWHVLRRRRPGSEESLKAEGTADNDTFSRTESGSHLNEFLIGSPARLALKNLINRMLSASRLGDSLKIRAVL